MIVDLSCQPGPSIIVLKVGNCLYCGQLDAAKQPKVSKKLTINNVNTLNWSKTL